MNIKAPTKPLQAAGEGARRLAASVWPNAQRHDIAGQAKRVREAMADAGRHQASFQISAFAAKIPLIDDLREAGLDRAIFTMPPLGPEVVIPKLDTLAEVTEVG